MPRNNPAKALNGQYIETPMVPTKKKHNMGKGATELRDITVKYKCDRNSATINMEAGSTVPLVDSPNADGENDYNPFEHRKLSHPTSDYDTFIHLLKGSLGSGILSMPRAVMNAGLWVGLLSTFFIGGVCTYCVHILVKTAQYLCKKTQTPALGFAETAEIAFLSGPPAMHKYSRLAKAVINTFLVIDLLGCCCIYVVFVATNLKQVAEHYTAYDMDLRIYMALLLPFLILLNLIRNLKFLAPFSMVANVLIGVGLAISYYYICQDLPPLDSRPIFASWSQLPVFFGTAIFALEGIGVVMPLENNMKNPHHFIGCPGVLNFGMFIVVLMYSITGFLGYLKYGDDTKATITLNLPTEDVLAQSVKVMIAAAVFLTYSLQFYVPMEIIWKNIRHRFEGRENSAEYTFRVGLVTGTVLLAIALPNLGPFISLIGAVCLSTLGMIFPAVIELVAFWDHPDYVDSKWFLVKNGLLCAFGVLGFVTGTIVSIQEFTE